MEIYETGSIEIGFSAFGPTLGLNGTLRAIHRDFFVHLAAIKLTRLTDSYTRPFEWQIFRALSFTPTGAPSGELQMASGFMLRTPEPHRYNTLFVDRPQLNEVGPLVTRVSQAWLKFLSSKGITFSPAPQVAEGLFEEFKKTDPEQTANKALTELQRLCYWNAGQYEVLFEIRTTQPDRVSNKGWKFALSESDKDSLIQNCARIVHDACVVSSSPYFFAYEKYEPN